MSLEISAREAGDVTILDLSGRVTLGEITIRLRDTIQELTQQGRSKILLNMADVSYVDSGGLGELTASFAAVGRPGGQLKLVNLSERVHGLLRITKLTTIFEKEAPAVVSFG